MCVIWNFPTMSVQWCIGILQRIVSDLAMYDDGRGIELDLLDSYQLQLELTYRELIGIGLLGELSDQQEPTLGLVREALSIVQSILERNDRDIQRG